MNFSENEIDELRCLVSKRLSEKRFLHTMGVEKAASHLGVLLLPKQESELRVAALLHDIAKECGTDEQLRYIELGNISLSESERKALPVLHSFAAPYVIKRDFPHFATDNVLSACKNHTVGAPDMSLFDEIIFVSDYVEEGRTYDSCKLVRKALWDSLKTNDREAIEKALHRAVVESMNFTMAKLLEERKHFDEKMLLTINAFASKI